MLRLKCRWRLPGWQVLEIPEVMWSSTPACCWFHFGAVVCQTWAHSEVHWQTIPWELCVHSAKAIPVTEQLWSSSFQGQDCEIQHHGKCCIPAARVCAGYYRVLGLWGSHPAGFISARSAHWRSISRKPETKISLLETVFFPFFSKQAGLLSVSCP